MGALRAVSLEDHLRDLAQCRAGLLAARADADLNLGKAGRLTAIDAEEVGMVAHFLRAALLKGETPDVIAQVDAGGQPRLDEVQETAVDRGAIVALGREVLGQLDVAHRAGDFGKLAKDGNAARGAAQADFLKCLAGVVE